MSRTSQAGPAAPAAPDAGTPRAESETIQAVLSTIDAEHREWVRLLRSLPADRLRAAIDGAWTPIDFLVHVTAWRGNALTVAYQQAAPAAPDPGPTRGPAGVLHINVDRFNAEVLAAHQGWTLDRAIAWSERGNADLLQALAQLPLGRVLGGRSRLGARPWYWTPAVIHTVGHRRQLERLLAAVSQGAS